MVVAFFTPISFMSSPAEVWLQGMDVKRRWESRVYIFMEKEEFGLLMQENRHPMWS